MSEEIENFGMYKDLKNILFNVIGRIEANYKADFDDENQYVATGFKDIYFKKGNLIILSSRPCIGKTSLALNILLNIVTKKKKAVGYITCGEFDEADITRKLLSFSSEIPMHKIKSAILKVEEVKNLTEKAGELWNAPIFINDSPNAMFAEVEFAARLMVEQQKVEIIFIDSYEYLQEVVDSEKDEYNSVHKDLLEEYKQVARELNIPIVMLMSLPSSYDDDKEPSISDFRKNMVIPRTADEVYFLHRDRIKDDRKKCEATLITGKNVNGLNYHIPLNLYPATGTFTDFSEE